MAVLWWNWLGRRRKEVQPISLEHVHCDGSARHIFSVMRDVARKHLPLATVLPPMKVPPLQRSVSESLFKISPVVISLSPGTFVLGSRAFEVNRAQFSLSVVVVFGLHLGFRGHKGAVLAAIRLPAQVLALIHRLHDSWDH